MSQAIFLLNEVSDLDLLETIKFGNLNEHIQNGFVMYIVQYT